MRLLPLSYGTQVEEGFATKAERRLANRLDELLQQSKKRAAAAKEEAAAQAALEQQRQESAAEPVTVAPVSEPQRPAQPPEGEPDLWYYRDPTGNIQVGAPSQRSIRVGSVFRDYSLHFLGSDCVLKGWKGDRKGGTLATWPMFCSIQEATLQKMFSRGLW